MQCASSFAMTKTLVLYVFHVYNDRVKQFINNAIFNDESIDFIVISNDKENKFEVPEYAKTMKRDNVGYDFGGWSHALIENNTYEKYDYFIFVNSSVQGPFISPYHREKYGEKWTNIFIDGLLKNNVKLFGSTINTCANPAKLAHVQSYIFATDKETAKYLIDCEIFSLTQHSKTHHHAIWQKEVLMSRKVIEKGWNIGCLMKHYCGVDFTLKTPLKNNVQYLNDIMWPHFRNIHWNEYEVVFIKGNRIQIDP